MPIHRRNPALPDLINNVGFNPRAQEQFIYEHGVVIEHYAATPSPLGLRDRGDYRRPDILDDDNINGFIYNKVGEFTGVIMNNSHNIAMQDVMLDQSMARLVLPNYYNNAIDDKTGHVKDNVPETDGDSVDGSTGSHEIKLLPGDRLYIKDIQVLVPNYQRVEHDPARNIDILQFPAEAVDFLMDSNGKKYVLDTDYEITDDGYIKWIGERPGHHPDTGDGLVYSIRYTYKAFWYVHQILNEIRITNLADSAKPYRLPYHAMIQREYVYHNVNKERSNQQDDNKVIKQPPIENLKPSQYEVKVDTRDPNEHSTVVENPDQGTYTIID